MKRTLGSTIFSALLILAATIAGQAQTASPAASIAERLGLPANSRLLIIQSDIGMMHAIDRATFEAVEKHWITSATVLVAAPWFSEAAAFAKQHPEGDYGIHLMLNSEWTPYRWGPVMPRGVVPSLVDNDGYFPSSEDAVLAHAKSEEIEQELRAQIEKAKAAGIDITHFDSHMDTLFASAPLFEIYRRLGQEYAVPVLAMRSAIDRFKVPADGLVVVDRRLEMRPGIPAAQWLDAYKRMLAPLPPGLYMLSVHLGYDDAEHRGATAGHVNWGAAWRQTDFDVIRNPEFQRFLKEQGFVMVTWRELGRVVKPGAASGY